MAHPSLTFAVSHYDRYVPFFDGSVTLDDVDLRIMHVGQSEDGRYGRGRHERMLQHNEFDICELSLSSYLMARARGLPFIAIPAFPRRLFSQSQIWINPARGIREPKDLIGKRVGLNTFQTTLSVLAKGDLQSEHGVPWRKIEWFIAAEEAVSFTPAPGVSIRKVPSDTNIGRMLQQGEIDAIFRPHPPRQVLEGASDICRLFSDPKAEEERYFHKNGYFPIMHVVAFRTEILDRHPQLARNLLDACAEADRICARYYDDPNWSRLAWGRHFFEEERRRLGPDLWPIGVRKNRANLERFIEYSCDQGLIDAPMPVDTLFAESVSGT
jgi:4,5-dihydroxyphthalate decarboxylase